MSLTTHPAAADPSATAEATAGVHPGRWPVLGILAGIGSLLTPVLNAPFVQDAAVHQAGYEAVFSELDGARITQLGAFVGYATCGLLLFFFFAVGFVRTMERRAPGARDLHLALGMALTAALATLAAGSMWRSVLTSGLPGGTAADFSTTVDVAVINTIEQQMIFAAFVLFVAVLAITAALVLRHRAPPRWTGLLSAVLATCVALVTLVLNLPWSAGLVTPIWLLAVSGAVLQLRRREV